MEKDKGSFLSGCIWGVLLVALSIIPLSWVLSGLFSSKTGSYTQSSDDDVIEDGMLRTGKYELKILSSDEKEYLGNTFFNSSAPTGAIYVVINYSYKNITDKPLSIWERPEIKLIDENGTEYSHDVGATTAYASEVNNNEKIISDLNPGITVNGSVVFEVSKELFNRDTWKIICR